VPHRSIAVDRPGALPLRARSRALTRAIAPALLLLLLLLLLLRVFSQDYVCNWLGNKAWTLALDWPGNEAFNAAADKAWYAPKSAEGAPEHAGDLKSAKGLSFLRVFAAGHMVPMDQPAASLAMLEQFIAGKI
jgi:cathepsin A (carboxypeptidase C)